MVVVVAAAAPSAAGVVAATAVVVAPVVTRTEVAAPPSRSICLVRSSSLLGTMASSASLSLDTMPTSSSSSRLIRSAGAVCICPGHGRVVALPVDAVAAACPAPSVIGGGASGSRRCKCSGGLEGEVVGRRHGVLVGVRVDAGRRTTRGR